MDGRIQFLGPVIALESGHAWRWWTGPSKDGKGGHYFVFGLVLVDSLVGYGIMTEVHDDGYPAYIYRVIV